MVTVRSIVAGTIGAAFIAATLAAGGAYAQQAPTVLKLAHGATPDNAIGKGMVKFAELVAAKTGGKVKVETYLAGSLYSERTALEAMVNGSIDFAGASNANWAAFTNALLFMDLPYVFNDEASFRKALDGKVGQVIGDRFEKAGFKLLMQLDNGGFRDIVNNRRPIRVPNDLKGLKFRTTASPV
ncbi:MAG: TRAP transporter substrate-binding protein, partial [Xanthobacteraceae bacterium]|nr:TRAP transporter substrate-binding protein [Xanthobacteraceae bacterium]